MSDIHNLNCNQTQPVKDHFNVQPKDKLENCIKNRRIFKKVSSCIHLSLNSSAGTVVIKEFLLWRIPGEHFDSVLTIDWNPVWFKCSLSFDLTFFILFYISSCIHLCRLSYSCVAYVDMWAGPNKGVFKFPD